MKFLISQNRLNYIYYWQIDTFKSLKLSKLLLLRLYITIIYIILSYITIRVRQTCPCNKM